MALNEATRSPCCEFHHVVDTWLRSEGPSARLVCSFTSDGVNWLVAIAYRHAQRRRFHGLGPCHPFGAHLLLASHGPPDVLWLSPPARCWMARRRSAAAHPLCLPWFGSPTDSPLTRPGQGASAHGFARAPDATGKHLSRERRPACPPSPKFHTGETSALYPALLRAPGHHRRA